MTAETYFYVYKVIDIHSRYVVGWMVATREYAELAEHLPFDTIEEQNVRREQRLTRNPLDGEPIPALSERHTAGLIESVGHGKIDVAIPGLRRYLSSKPAG